MSAKCLEDHGRGDDEQEPSETSLQLLLVQLDGEPDYSPRNLLSRSHSEYVEGNSLVKMLKEDLIAERIAIESYREMISYFGDDDPTTRRVMEEILAVEEQHADDLSTLLQDVDPVH